jgi:CDP-glucose 4,6-dehydratase
VGRGRRALEGVGVADPSAWSGRRVLLTGHTGFKGAWLALWLRRLGAEVTGLADAVPTDPSLFALAGLDAEMRTVWADVRDHGAVAAAVRDSRAEVVLHRAAQPFVRRSFREPRETYEVNVMGTVNVLDAVRASDHVGAVVVVTSDKCYDNREQGRPFTEDDCMGGHDPYSNSKGCAELVTDAYRRSFFSDAPRVASGRAGNVIGGGDWGEERLIPDLMRGALAGERVPIRRPDAIRPWQHVLNPLAGYLLLAERLLAGDPVDSGWNFGPAADDVRPVRWIAERLSAAWPGELHWDLDPGPHPHEATYLALDSAKAREQLGWTPRWDLGEALDRIVEWYAALQAGDDVAAVTARQLDAFTADG